MHVWMTVPCAPRAALWMATAACSLFACRQIIGIDVRNTEAPNRPARDGAAPSDGGSEAGLSACGLSYGTSTCAACAQASCCHEATDCAASPVCDAYESCLGACAQGDFACRAQCQIDHPVGSEFKVSALSACLVAHCENECGLTCGALAGWAVEPDAAAASQACVVSSGCGEVRACASSEDCDAINRCIAACPTFDCMDVCGTSRGVDPAWAWTDAGETNATSTYAGMFAARTACSSASGNYWECVGHIAWPQVQARSTILQTRVADSVTEGTIPGMEVAVCGSTDTDCTMPWSVGYTDPSGLVSLVVPLPIGALDTTGYLRMTSPPTSPNATVPYYEYWGFPLTQDHFVFGRSGSGVGASFATPAESQSLGNLIAAELDGGLDPKSRSTLTVAVFDCLGAPASGALVTLSSADARTVALANMNFAPSAPITDSTGAVIFVNVPAGPVTVTAKPPAIGKPSGTVAATVRAGTGGETTIVIVPPTPL
jgi:hypothetical protein